MVPKGSHRCDLFRFCWKLLEAPTSRFTRIISPSYSYFLSAASRHRQIVGLFNCRGFSITKEPVPRALTAWKAKFKYFVVWCAIHNRILLLNLEMGPKWATVVNRRVLHNPNKLGGFLVSLYDPCSTVIGLMGCLRNGYRICNTTIIWKSGACIVGLLW